MLIYLWISSWATWPRRNQVLQIRGASTKYLPTMATADLVSSTITLASTQSTPPYASRIPDIDICGIGSDNVTCPGSGSNLYFYRCCSAAGHCGTNSPLPLRSVRLVPNPGPKNNVRFRSLYAPHCSQPLWTQIPCRFRTKLSIAVPVVKPLLATAKLMRPSLQIQQALPAFHRMEVHAVLS